MRPIGRVIVGIGAASVTLATFVGLWGHLAWWLDLFSHFQVQYALLLIFCIAAQLLLRPRWLAAVWAMPLMVNLALMAPLYLPRADRAEDPLLSVLHINLDRNIHDPSAAMAFLRSQQADLVFLQEVTPRWLEAIERLEGYHVLIAQSREDSRGVAALLRIGTSLSVSPRIIQLCPDLTDRPMVELLVQTTSRPLALLSLHVKRPSNAANSAIQRAELVAAYEWASLQREQGHAVIVIGDINATPWSSGGRLLVREGVLANSQHGFGIQPTWPAPLPWPLRIPIDHCYHSTDLRVTHREPGPATGSDHLPLMVRVAFKGERAKR